MCGLSWLSETEQRWAQALCNAASPCSEAADALVSQPRHTPLTEVELLRNTLAILRKGNELSGSRSSILAPEE